MTETTAATLCALAQKIAADVAEPITTGISGASHRSA